MQKKLSILLILVLIMTTIPLSISAAAGSSTIRIALLFDSGGALNTAQPVATISSAKGVQISPKSGIGTYITTSTNNPIQASLNQYRILVDETSDFGYASSLVQNLKSKGYFPYLLMMHRKNVAYYQVITGDEPTYEMANATSLKIKSQIGVARDVIGPNALSAGTYLKEDDAKAVVQTVIDAGFDASVGYALDANGMNSYIALVGNTGTQEKLASIWQEVSLALPNLSLSKLDKTNYVATFTGFVQSGSTNLRVPHYYFPVNEAVTIRAQIGDAIPTLTIMEKENRKYRGDLEILSYKGKLALVNQLPLEEYLYSVVGTEMSSGWPLEALKAQVVIARTYAIGKGNRYTIANLSDTTYDQAYYGVAREADDVRQAVQETAGLVLSYQGKLIEAYYSANAGGITAVGAEVWGTELPYIRSVTSPDDVMSRNALDWYQVLRNNGQMGYIRSDLVRSTSSKTDVGFDIVEVIDDNTNLRSDPSTSKASLDKLMAGEKLVKVAVVPENSSYSWIEGPIDGFTLMNKINERAGTSGIIPQTRPIDELKVESRGPSGRVTSIVANGIPIRLSSPDGYRTLLGGLRSTLFEIEETGRFTILGANGNQVDSPEVNETLTIIGAGNKTTKVTSDVNSLLAYGKDQNVRVVTMYPSFSFIGKGYGHGFGLSQVGARGLAEQGYDFSRILKHYYTDQVNLQPIE